MKGKKEPRQQKFDRDHRINRQDQAVPGAVSVQGNAARSGRSSTPQTTGQFGDSVLLTNPAGSTPLEPQIVAFLAPDDDDRIDEKIAQKAEELLRRQMEEGEVIMAAEVNGDGSSTCCGLKTRTLVLLGILTLLLIIGGVVGGVLSYRVGVDGPTSLQDLLDLRLFSNSELRSIDGSNYGNRLKGTIPTELGQLTSLTSLDLNNNRLTGTIPTELGKLISLEKLDFRGNERMSGSIPTELGQLTSLTSLDLCVNDLTGTIPTELGQLTSLTYLALYSNDLTGTIPSQLVQLLSLEKLALLENQLTGTIPSELAGIGNLTLATFFGNQLTGSLEQSFCVENRTWDPLSVDCDKVECSCCCCGCWS